MPPNKQSYLVNPIGPISPPQLITTFYDVNFVEKCRKMSKSAGLSNLGIASEIVGVTSKSVDVVSEIVNVASENFRNVSENVGKCCCQLLGGLPIHYYVPEKSMTLASSRRADGV